MDYIEAITSPAFLVVLGILLQLIGVAFAPSECAAQESVLGLVPRGNPLSLDRDVSSLLHVSFRFHFHLVVLLGVKIGGRVIWEEKNEMSTLSRMVNLKIQKMDLLRL